ncbi:hypothetical protein ACFW3D_09715 [Streptomyces sp. NPDC058864]
MQVRAATEQSATGMFDDGSTVEVPVQALAIARACTVFLAAGNTLQM